MEKKFTVVSDHADIIVDEKGKVISINYHKEGDTCFDGLIMVNVAEWKDYYKEPFKDCDVLDIGLIYKGDYEAPEKDYRGGLLKELPVCQDTEEINKDSKFTPFRQCVTNLFTLSTAHVEPSDMEALADSSIISCAYGEGAYIHILQNNEAITEVKEKFSPLFVSFYNKCIMMMIATVQIDCDANLVEGFGLSENWK